MPFQIVEISHIWGDVFGSDGEAGVQPPVTAPGEARTGREAVKPLTDWINVVVGTQSMEQSPTADDPSDTKTARLAKQIQSIERSASLDHPFPKAATPISPGQPTTFSLGPVDNPTLFSGDYSFRLLVPENATSVTVTLESSVDVDLYVRYGEDTELQDGRVVSDYSSEGPTGNEEIVITPQSDRPLHAGTYFVSIVLFDTGVTAMCTLTVTVERDDAPLPPISGGPLTPGQPAAFRLGPVESPTLFTVDHSFRMEVPTGATRVIFTMESVDPDVDVALLVRFGEDNRIQNGRPVFDYGSQNPTGNERVGITRRSDPPLRAGTYFVSVLVFDTGVVAEGTLTAAVETDTTDCHLDVTCYLEWSNSASGVARIYYETSKGSFACSGTLLNNSREDFTPYFLTAAHCVATEAEARSVVAHWFYQTQTCNGELPDFLTVPRTMGASLLSTLGDGPIEGRENPDGDMTLLRLEGDLPNGVWFQGWNANPQPFGAQVTGIHHPGSDDWDFFKRISFGQIIPDPASRIPADAYAFVSNTQGYTEGGSSGSALFSSPGTVVGALGFGRGNDAEAENACRTGSARHDGYTHFSVFYPHIRPFIDSTLPEITGGPLPPRQPAAFRLGPVDTPMLFSGDSSFQVEVPENTSRATFTLESVDPDVNVDLYVRYGEDNAIQGGRVVSDYSSTGPTGNEQIVVTPQSDPPLRAGTYFVSLMLRTTGAVAEVTLTAEFDAPAPTPPGGQIYYFPHLAVGAGWQTTITYINYSTQQVTCRTDFLSDQGTPLLVSFPGRGTVTSRPDVLPPGGSVHQETNVALSAPLAPGWARATCSGPVKASLLFRLHNSEGVPIGEAAVNATAVAATRFVTFAEQGEGNSGTGVAYANPSATEARITFTVRDTAGQMLASVVRTLLPGGHGAQNMEGLFDLSSFAGSLKITSTEPIVSLSLNFEAAPVFSSLPPGETPAMVIPATGAPDLVVQTPSVSNSSPNAGETFTLRVTARNQGNGPSASTTLRYYRSNDTTISTSDTQVGTDAVSALSASGASDESISLTSPSTPGTYYYGACVDPVAGESDTANNCSLAVTVTVASSTGKPFNQLQTERLIGTWVFSYTISTSEFTQTYRLNDVRESSITPGEWNIYGTDQYDNLVIVGYSPSLGMFSLFDPGIIIDQFFTFDFVGSSTVSVSGCYYLVDKDDDSLSRCYDMTGVRTSSSTLSSLTRAVPNTTAAHAELGEIEEAKKLGIEMQIEVDPKIIRVLEDFREVLHQ